MAKAKAQEPKTIADFVAMAQQQQPVVRLATPTEKYGNGKAIIDFLLEAFGAGVTEVFLPPIVEAMAEEGLLTRVQLIEAIIQGKAKLKKTRLGSTSTLQQPLKDVLIKAKSGKALRTVRRRVGELEKGQSREFEDEADLRDVIEFYHGKSGDREGLTARLRAKPRYKGTVKAWVISGIRPRTTK